MDLGLNCEGTGQIAVADVLFSVIHHSKVTIMFPKLCFLWLFILFSMGIHAQEEGAEGEGGAGGALQYVELRPAFVTNFGGPGKLRYMKAEITLRVATEGMGPIRQHMPYLRHVIIRTLSNQTEEDISSMEGKELLRQACLEAVRNVLVEEEGAHAVNDLLFNSLIVQM